MKIYNLRYLLWKEYQELFLNNKRLILISIFLYTIILNFALHPIFKTINQMGASLKGSFSFPLLNYTLIFVPFLIIFLFGVSFFREAFYKEKINRTLENLLAIQLDIREIWVSKIFVICTLSYFIFIIVSFFTISFLLVLDEADFLRFLDSITIFNFFFASPLFSFSILGFLGYLELFLKNASQIAILFIVPFFFSIKFFKKFFTINLKTSFLIIIFALFIFVITYILLLFLKKEKIIANI